MKWREQGLIKAFDETTAAGIVSKIREKYFELLEILVERLEKRN